MIRGTIEDTDCDHCPFSLENGPNRPVLAIGPENPDFIIVSESPGVSEDRVGIPLIGKSGQMVDKLLKLTGSSRERVWLTHSFLCRPPDGSSDKDKTKAAKCCYKRLQNETKQFPGKPILTLGGVAAQKLIDKSFAITEMAGTITEKDIDGTGNRLITSTFHPAYILMSDGQKQHLVDVLFTNLVYDFSKIVQYVKGNIRPLELKIHIEISNYRQARRLIDKIYSDIQLTKWFACDTETDPGISEYLDINGDLKTFKHSALEARWAKLNAIGLATEDYSISIIWKCMTARAKNKLGKLLADESIQKVFHNELYDKPILKWNGFPVKGETFDTMLAHHSAHPGLSHGLQRVAAQYYLVKGWKSEYRSEGDSLEDHVTYCATDTLLTAKIKQPLIKRLKDTGREKSFMTDRRMAKIAYDMHIVGIPISRDINRQLQEQLKPIVDNRKGQLANFLEDEEIKDTFIEYFSMEMAKTKRKNDSSDFWERVDLRKVEIRDNINNGNFKFNPGYSGHIAPFLKSLKIPLKQLTKKGKLATGKSILESFGSVPEVRAVLDYRKVDKLLSTFVKGVLKFLDENDRLHPMWSVNKNSGRWSSKFPSCQNWSAGDEDNEEFPIPNLRRQITAKPGNIIISADFDKAEARLVGLFSQDKFILENLQPGKDLHTAVMLTALPGSNKLIKGTSQFKKARTLAKNIEFGSIYGADALVIWETIIQKKEYSHVKLSDVRVMQERLMSQMSGVKEFHNSLIKEVETKKVLKTLIDERCWDFPINSQDTNYIRNWIIQSSFASIVNAGLWKLYNRLPKSAYIIIQVHDSVTVECLEEDADKVKNLIEDSMTMEVEYNGNTMLFPLEIGMGNSLADC